MRKICSLCAFVFLLGTVAVYAVLGVRLACCPAVFTNAGELSSMAVEALADFAFFCLGARVLLLMVRQHRIASVNVWWFFVSVMWFFVIHACSSQLQSILGLWFCIGNPKYWLLLIHSFIAFPVSMSFLLSLSCFLSRTKI